MALNMRTTLPAGLADAMVGTALLAGTDRAAVDDLATAGTVRQYRRGTYLFHQGDESDFVARRA